MIQIDAPRGNVNIGLQGGQTVSIAQMTSDMASMQSQIREMSTSMQTQIDDMSTALGTAQSTNLVLTNQVNHCSIHGHVPTRSLQHTAVAQLRVGRALSTNASTIVRPPGFALLLRWEWDSLVIPSFTSVNSGPCQKDGQGCS